MCIGDCKRRKHMQRFDLQFQFSMSQLLENTKKTKLLQPVNHAILQITNARYTWVLIGSDFIFAKHVNKQIYLECINK